MKKNNQKFLSLILSLVMVLSIVGVYPVSADNSTENVSKIEIQLTKAAKNDVKFDFSKEVNADNLTWTLDGKSLDQWKSFNEKTEKYDKEPWIKVENVKVDGKTLSATIENTLPYGVPTTDNRPYPRWTFETLMGVYPLTVTDNSTNESQTIYVKINNYEGFHEYDQIKPVLDKIISEGNSKNDRYFEYESIGKSVEGRDLHFVIVAKDKAAIDNYLNNTYVVSHTNPSELIEKINNKTMEDYQIPLFFNNIHPDESPGVDSQIDLLTKLSTEDKISFKYNGQDRTLNVKDVLDNFILLFDITQNPDGKAHNKRENANGLDINRDNVYQTQPETKALAKTLSKYDPLVFLDLHGFVKEFLIEPCTPPHEPNFEYDLLMGGPRDKNGKDFKRAPGAIENAKRMGDTAISNTKYDSYIIPMFDYGDGWDDDFLGYTGVFAMIHGALGHTVEIPEQNRDSLMAHEYTMIGTIDYAFENKDALYKNQLNIFRRGLENEDNRAVDTWHIDPQGNQIGRPRHNNENFFPDYYILPMDENQSNKLEVTNMVNYFLNNNVKVYKTNSDVEYNGKTYKSGAIVIPLNQVKKSLVNAALFTGSDESAWGSMYAEVVLNFPAMRGFDSIEIRHKGLFDNKLSAIENNINKPSSSINVDTNKAVVSNSNNDSVKLVNALLKDNKEVSIITDASKDYKIGDFIVNSSDLDNYSNKYYIIANSLNGEVKSEKLVEPKIYITPSGSDYASTTDSTRFVLKSLGFNLVDKISDANTIVDSSGEIENTDIGSKNYIAIGGEALGKIKDKKIYPVSVQMNEKGYGNEGLLKANYDLTSPITGNYLIDDLSYVASGNVITSGSPSAKILSKVSDVDDYFVQGWWPNHDFIKGKGLILTDNYENNNIVLFAADITNKGHSAHLFRLLSNAIYSVNNNTSTVGDGLYVSKLIDIDNSWAKYNINFLVNKGAINGYPDNTFKPKNSITRAEFLKTLVKGLDLKMTKMAIPKFDDVENHWAKKYINTALSLGIVEGYENNEFRPNNYITREEMAKVISNLLNLKEEGKLNFKDNDKISKWAKKYVNKTVKSNFLEGYPDNTFKPKEKLNRAEGVSVIVRIINKDK